MATDPICGMAVDELWAPLVAKARDIRFISVVTPGSGSRRLDVCPFEQRTMSTQSTVVYWELSLSRSLQCTRMSKDPRSLFGLP